MNAPLELNERELLALAERAEAATGSDRELDYHVHALVKGWRTPTELQCFSWCVGDNYQFGDPNSERIAIYISEGELPEYTASLDSAMTLVPEGHMVAYVGQNDNGRWWAEIRRGFITSFDKAFPVLEAATPALALTSACLRAIAAKGERT